MSIPPSPYGQQPGSHPDPQGSRPSYGQAAPQQGSPYGAPQQGSPYGAPQQGSPYSAPQSASPYGGQPSPYGAPQGAPAPQQPVKRKGIKRMIFGGLGVLANGLGLLVMPFLIGFIGIVFGVVGALSTIEPIEGSSATLPSEAVLMYVWVPASDSSTTCEISGPGVTAVEPGDPGTTASVNGREYVNAAMVSGTADGSSIDISCPGASGIAVSEVGLGEGGIGMLIGVIIPGLLLLVALGLLIWGIVAFVRSKPQTQF